VEVATRHSQVSTRPVYAVMTRCMTDCNLYRTIGTVLKQHCFKGTGPEFTSPSGKRLTFLPWRSCVMPILLYLLWTIILVLWKKETKGWSVQSTFTWISNSQANYNASLHQYSCLFPVHGLITRPHSFAITVAMLRHLCTHLNAKAKLEQLMLSKTDPSTWQ
jgi:hypothetical protein